MRSALNVNVSRSLPVHLIRRVLRAFSRILFSKQIYSNNFQIVPYLESTTTKEAAEETVLKQNFNLSK